MKRIKNKFIALVFIGFGLSSNAQWTDMTTPSIYHLYSIETVTEDLVYAGGYGGAFIKTNQGRFTFFCFFMPLNMRRGKRLKSSREGSILIRSVV